MFQFDRTVIFLRGPVDVAGSPTETSKAATLETAEATSAVLKLADSNPPGVDVDPCSILPDGAVRDVLGSSATHSRERTRCRYKSVVGEMESATFPPNSYYSRDYETLTAEGMGSLQVHNLDHSITIVLDRDNPVLA